MKISHLFFLLFLLLPQKSTAQTPVVERSAEALIKGTQEGSEITGDVTLREEAGGLVVKVSLYNVPNPGKHGFHIHDKGSCDEGGTAAGGHFNPKDAPHGFIIKNGLEHAHAGDMGNILINEDGTGNFAIFLAGIDLGQGEMGVDGRAIILHEKEDDFGQPTGNAGGRIGCGIIKVH